MLFRVQVVLVAEILAVIGTLIRPYWGLLLLIFCTFARPQDDRPNIQPLHIEEALTIAVLVATAIRPSMLLPRLSFAFRKIRWFLALFALMTLSALVNGWTPDSAYQVGDSLTVAIVCFLILIWARTEKEVAAVVWLLMGAGLYYFKMTVQNPTYFREDAFTRLGFRGNTNFGNPNFLALLMVIVIFFSLSFLGAARNAWLKLGLLSTAGACFFVFLKCQSRGSTLALVAAMMVYWLMQEKKFLTVVAFGAAVSLSLAFMAPKTYVDRLKSIVNYQTDQSAMGRIDFWERSLEMIASNPVLGIGPANFEVVTRSQQFPYGISQHEAYLQMASEVGVPAALLYIALLIGGIRAAWITRRLASHSHKDLGYLSKIAEGLLCGIVAIVVAGFFTGLAFREFVYILLALTYCAREVAESETADEWEEAAMAAPASYVEA
jgi:putative inorganic carbon (hco3(-)) transporter